MDKNIFLDTNIYEENNFFHSTDIQSLFYYSKIGVINLYMTSISKMEFIDRMHLGISKVNKDHNDLVSLINQTRILRNLAVYSKIEKSKLIINDSISELTEKLNLIIKISNIKIIPSQNASVDDIFNLYYKKEPPFSIEAKKHEFPDAFIAKSIDSWCKTKRKKMVFITRDKNFNGYKSTSIIFKQELSEVLAEITEYFDSKQKTKYIPYINESIKRNQVDLLELLDSEIEPYIKMDVDYERTSNLNRNKVKFKDYKISSIRPDYAEIIYTIEFDYSFLVFPTELDIDKSIFSDNINPTTITGKKVLTCDLQLNFKRNNDIKIKLINSNQKIIINI